MRGILIHAFRETIVDLEHCEYDKPWSKNSLNYIEVGIVDVDGCGCSYAIFRKIQATRRLEHCLLGY